MIFIVIIVAIIVAIFVERCFEAPCVCLGGVVVREPLAVWSHSIQHFANEPRHAAPVKGVRVTECWLCQSLVGASHTGGGVAHWQSGREEHTSGGRGAGSSIVGGDMQSRAQRQRERERVPGQDNLDDYFAPAPWQRTMCKVHVGAQCASGTCAKDSHFG